MNSRGRGRRGPRWLHGPVIPRAPDLLLVALGGALGTLARWAVGRALPPAAGWPLGTLAVNAVGALALGLLLEALARRGAETPRARALRLAAGTGVLGGFTTWSGLALEADRLAAGGDVLQAAGYLLGSVALGLLAASAGIALGARTRRPAGPRSTP